jgi:hypothetical protein
MDPGVLEQGALPLFCVPCCALTVCFQCILFVNVHLRRTVWLCSAQQSRLLKGAPAHRSCVQVAKEFNLREFDLAIA